jgi:hypothetical protein
MHVNIIDSVSALLFVKDTIEERGAVICEFHIGDTDHAVSKNKLIRMAQASILAIEETRQNLFWSNGVCVVNHGIILDTNERQ